MRFGGALESRLLAQSADRGIQIALSQASVRALSCVFYCAGLHACDSVFSFLFLGIPNA